MKNRLERMGYCTGVRYVAGVLYLRKMLPLFALDDFTGALEGGGPAGGNMRSPEEIPDQILGISTIVDNSEFALTGCCGCL